MTLACPIMSVPINSYIYGWQVLFFVIQLEIQMHIYTLIVSQFKTSIRVWEQRNYIHI